ncbi:Centrosomal protein of 152 kDa [Clarias magur]|uniref:Centrosomal protein of 152 kDa n=1 Tax=Clarias magur TaxID=1594786 RepID=A0A8J4WSE9_CLAMG|nr:Centrosomal protein of 152 kDa [Clarias magur]
MAMEHLEQKKNLVWIQRAVFSQPHTHWCKRESTEGGAELSELNSEAKRDEDEETAWTD